MSFRLVQISDTHLSPRHGCFQDNFDTLLGWLAADPPDLIVVTGDLSLDGADSAEDLAHARAQLGRLPARCLMLPGNHDVGDYAALGGKQPVDEVRLARWAREMGPDRFVEDVPGWRLIGLNSQILGSGLAAEAAQWAALESALAGAAGRRVGLFLHKPLCQHALADTAVTYWPVLQPARDRLAGLLRSAELGFVASGHIHQWRDHAADGIRQIWAPSVAFVVGGASQAAIGNKLVGIVEWRLHQDGAFSADLRALPGLLLHDIVALPALYGQI
jgi:3',5'-cyclic AMP phosphodiesterase CpdA